MKKVILLLLGIFVFTSFSYAELTGDCAIVPAGSCSNRLVGGLLFNLDTNSHVCFSKVVSCPDYGYNYELCCPGNGNMGFDEDDPALFSLSRTANAHIGQPLDYTARGLIFSTDIGSTNCAVKQVSSCPVGEYCLFSLNGESNAHVATCSGPSSYEYKLCCSNVLYIPPPEVIPNESYLDIESFTCDDESEITAGAGDNINVKIEVSQTENSVTSPSNGANVKVYLDLGDTNTNVLATTTTNSNGEGQTSFILPGGLGAGKKYYAYANVTKSGFLSDAGSPRCKITINSDDSNEEEIPSGTYAIYGECKCSSGSCDDNIGHLDMWIYSLEDNKLVQERLNAIECFLSEEKVPFTSFYGILVFFLIIGLFYGNEIFKNKNKLNK